MQLVEDWQAVLKKAWSVKFNIAATLFGAAEVVVALVQPAGIPNGVFAGLAGLTTTAAVVARVLAQKELSDGADK
ncbi:hypothetical protein HHL21_12310 [Massilia sp. RP-1-19]|uniref:Uncharacterized protein n=1 Tax=Massilia polaris TaxID=2728846 RepID=A0A848HKT9_9BURK|nr:hypothetical protein [Massilia polaris]NML61844.1 hypothetical protein [Massilia polaris]